MNTSNITSSFFSSEILKEIRVHFTHQPYAAEMMGSVIEAIRNGEKLHEISFSQKKAYCILLSGPTGTGKSEMINFTRKCLHRGFVDESLEEYTNLMITVMGSFTQQEVEMNSYIFGISPGYIGYSQHHSLIDRLNDAVNKFQARYNRDPPHLILMFDEIDKCAHLLTKLQDFLQNGRLFSPSSNKVFILPENTLLIVMYNSNYGQDTNDRRSIPLSIHGILEEMKKHQGEENINGIDMVIPFFLHNDDCDNNQRKLKLLQQNEEERLTPFLPRLAYMDAWGEQMSVLPKNAISHLYTTLTPLHCQNEDQNEQKLKLQQQNEESLIPVAKDITQLKVIMKKRFYDNLTKKDAFSSKYGPAEITDETVDKFINATLESHANFTK